MAGGTPNCESFDYSQLTAPEQGIGLSYRCLVAGVEIIKCPEAKLSILIESQVECIEATA